MPTIRLSWTDTNTFEQGYRVYRSSAAMDPNALPAPMATLAPNAATYDDTTVTPDAVYYYRVAAYLGTASVVSAELVATASSVILNESFETGSALGGTWTRRTDWSIHGTYSLGSPTLADNGSADATYSVTLTEQVDFEFNWKVSSEAADRFRFLINGTEQFNASGENSGFYSVTLTAGAKSMIWRYAKDATYSTGSDRAWIDRIVIKPKRIIAAGTLPIIEDFEAGSILSGGWGRTTAWSTNGSYSLVCLNPANNANIDATYTLVLTSPAVIKFDWKVSSEANWDKFQFLINGTATLTSSGENTGSHTSATLAAGTYNLIWRYSKDGGGAAGQDRAWIDNLRIEAP